MVRLRTITLLAALLLVLVAIPSAAQDASKRNDRPQETPSPVPQRAADDKKPADPTRYSYEFTQPEFVIRHIVIEHDASGQGKTALWQKDRREALPAWQAPGP